MKYSERKAALRRQILDADPEAAIVSLAENAAKVAEPGAPTERPSDDA